jgi:hypothetical protein
MHNFIRNSTIITDNDTKGNQKHDHLRVFNSRSSPSTFESRSLLLLGNCFRQLRKSCASANTVHSRAERMFILEHYFVSKSFAVVREAFSSAYPDSEGTNMTTAHSTGNKTSEHRKCCLWQLVIERQNCWDCVRTDFKRFFSCNSGIWLQDFNIVIGFVVLCAGDYVYQLQLPFYMERPVYIYIYIE